MRRQHPCQQPPQPVSAGQREIRDRSSSYARRCHAAGIVVRPWRCSAPPSTRSRPSCTEAPSWLPDWRSQRSGPDHVGAFPWDRRQDVARRSKQRTTKARHVRHRVPRAMDQLMRNRDAEQCPGEPGRQRPDGSRRRDRVRGAPRTLSRLPATRTAPVGRRAATGDRTECCGMLRAALPTRSCRPWSATARRGMRPRAARRQTAREPPTGCQKKADRISNPGIAKHSRKPELPALPSRCSIVASRVIRTSSARQLRSCRH